MPSAEAHHLVNGPDTGSNSGERRIIKNHVGMDCLINIEQYLSNFNHEFVFFGERLKNSRGAPLVVSRAVIGNTCFAGT